MTFAELVKKVATKYSISETKADGVIREALKLSADEALNKRTAPVFPGIGRFVASSVRSTGRKPDGTQWTKPGRVKLALRPSVHVGGDGGNVKPSVAKAASSVAA